MHKLSHPAPVWLASSVLACIAASHPLRILPLQTKRRGLAALTGTDQYNILLEEGTETGMTKPNILPIA